MKRIISKIVVIFAACIVLYAGDSIIEDFKASSNGSVISLEWRSTGEGTVQKYEIEKKSTSTGYSWLENVQPKGYAAYYKYDDRDVAMKLAESKSPSVLGGNQYSYRIKVVYKDNTYSYTGEVNVVHKVSGIKKTWGMIKDMFK